MRYVRNSAWMLAEYALKVISAIFVGIYLARYLGPDQFGVLSYALAVVAIFMAMSRLGMESILVRDLAKHPEQRQAYLSTAFSLVLMAAVVGVIVLGILVYLLESDPETQVYIWIISTGILFQTLLVIEYNFQSQVKAKYSSIAKSLALSFTAVSKLVFIWYGAELIHIAILYAIDHAVIGLMLLIMHVRNRQVLFIKGFSSRLVKPLLKSAWPMVLSAIAATLYVRMDQLMIKNMLNVHELGLYAAAIKVYEGWIIVPYVISISLLPAIVKLRTSSVKNYERNMSILFSVLFWSSFSVALIATFFGDWIIRYTFGTEYLGSTTVLAIVMWAAIFSSLGSVSARYLTVEGMEKKIAVRTFLGLVLNIILNLVLIPLYGIEGAAYATLTTLFFANYIINYFDRNLQQLVGICNRSITLKWLFNEKN